jgi:hypothetical protein
VPNGQSGANPATPQNAGDTGAGENYTPPGRGATGGGAPAGTSSTKPSSGSWASKGLVWGLVIAAVLIGLAMYLYNRARPAGQRTSAQTR